MANKAFLIGINTSGLKYCENDVKLMKECLEVHSFEVQIASNFIKRDIVDQFEKWIDNMNKTDTALFYYSGHGFAPRGNLLLTLNDNLEKITSRLDINIITNALEESKAINKLIILDCCRAGTVENTWTPQQSDFYRILTASERLEKGKEIDNLKASFLTHSIHDLLFNNYQELINNNKELRLNTLYEKLKQKAELHNQIGTNIKVAIPNLLGNQKADFIISIIDHNKQPKKPQKYQITQENLPQQFYSKFVGRKSTLKKLLKYISPNYRQHITVIDGIGGVGKTALVIEIAYRCLKNSLSRSSPNIPVFDAIIFTSAKQNYLMPCGIVERPMYETTLQDIFRTIATVLKDSVITQLSGREQISRVKQKLKEQSTLLIIDNMETLEEKERMKVISFINDLPSPTKVIITTRSQVLLESNAAIRLEELSIKEGVELIQQQAEEKNKQITNEDAKQIYRRFGGIPVALIYVVGQKFMGYSIDKLINTSISLPNDITSFCFETSVEPLRGETAFKLLMSIAIFRDSPTKEAVATVAGFPANSDAVITGFARLLQLSLIKEKEENRLSMMTITREYVLQELNKNSEFEQLSRERLVEWYLDFVEIYGGNDWKNWRSNYNKLGKEWENIASVLYWCAAKKRYENVLKLWRGVDNYVDIGGYWQNRDYWWQWLIIESKRNGDLSTYVEALSEKGWTLTLMGGKHHREAAHILTKAWKSRKYADFIIQANLVNHIAINRITIKKYKQALQWLKREEVFVDDIKTNIDELNYFRHHIRISYYRGEINFRQEKYDQAKKLFEYVCEQGNEIGWQRFVNYAQNWLADILIIEGSLQKAERLLDTGISVAKANRETRRIGHYQAAYARLEVENNNLEKAKEWAINALSHFQQENVQEDAQEMENLIEAIHSKLDL
jgi:predicted ATPase